MESIVWLSVIPYTFAGCIMRVAGWMHGYILTSSKTLPADKQSAYDFVALRDKHIMLRGECQAAAALVGWAALFIVFGTHIACDMAVTTAGMVIDLVAVIVCGVWAGWLLGLARRFPDPPPHRLPQ